MRALRSVFSSRLYLSALGVALILVLCVSYLYAEVLDRPLTSTPDEITVELTAAGGLFEGSAVTYRGVKVGKVTRIELGDTGVEATVTLTSGTAIPRSSQVLVRSLSPVGEQYLDFQPTTAGGPYLQDGEVIPASSTDIPQTLGSTVVALNKVLSQVDDDKLRTLLVEASKALAGTGDDLGTLVDEGALLLDELDSVYPETQRLLRNSDTVLDIATDQRADLTRLAGDAKSLAAFLRSYDPELERFLERGPQQVRELQALIADARRVVPDFLSIGVSLTDVFAAHDPHLRALLQIYAPGLRVLGEKVRNGAIQLELIFDKSKRCSYGTPHRDPRDPERRELPRDLRCSASFSTLQRGAAHAPGPVRR